MLPGYLRYWHDIAEKPERVQIEGVPRDLIVTNARQNYRAMLFYDNNLQVAIKNHDPAEKDMSFYCDVEKWYRSVGALNSMRASKGVLTRSAFALGRIVVEKSDIDWVSGMAGQLYHEAALLTKTSDQKIFDTLRGAASDHYLNVLGAPSTNVQDKAVALLHHNDLLLESARRELAHNPPTTQNQGLFRRRLIHQHLGTIAQLRKLSETDGWRKEIRFGEMFEYVSILSLQADLLTERAGGRFLGKFQDQSVRSAFSRENAPHYNMLQQDSSIGNFGVDCVVTSYMPDNIRSRRTHLQIKSYMLEEDGIDYVPGIEVIGAKTDSFTIVNWLGNLARDLKRHNETQGSGPLDYVLPPSSKTA